MNEDNRVAPERAALEKEVAAHPFLIGMSDRHVRLLADCAMRSHFHAGEVIFREGEAANRFYLIERGKIALESSTLGEPVRIEEIGDDDLLGWSWLFPLTPGISRRGPWKRPTPFSFTAQSCANTARKIILSASNSLNE